MSGRVDEQLTTKKYALSDDMGVMFESFIIDRRAQSLSHKTVDFYRDTLGNFTRFCETRAITRLEQVTPDELRRYLIYLAETGHNEHGITAYWRGVRAFIRWSWDEMSFESKPPTDRVKSPRTPKELLNPVELTDVQSLLSIKGGSEFFDLRDRAMILTLIDTGMRAGELLALDLDCIDPTGSVEIRRGKGRKGRVVYLSQTTRKAIRAYLRNRGDDNQALFVTEKGSRLTYTGLRLMVQRRSKLAGIEPPELHSFRRAYVIESLRSGANLLELQDLLGHSDLSTLRRYAKMTGDDLRAAHGRTSPVDKMRGRK